MTDAAPNVERRRGDRRRSPRAAPPAESWFGAIGIDDTLPQPDLGRADADTGAAAGAMPDDGGPGVPPGEDSAGDSGHAGATRPPGRRLGTDQTSFVRLYRVFLGARAVLGLAVIGTLVLAGLFGARPGYPVVVVAVIYASAALALWLLPRFRGDEPPLDGGGGLRSPQWIATIGTDIGCFTALHLLSTSSSFNYVALLVLPVLMAGVLTPRLQALATAAAVALMLLVTAWLAVLEGGNPTALMSQAGLAGIGLFVVTVLVGELAGRLAREEMTAKGSLELARQQAQLNRLVIEEMQDGVLVVDRRGRVRAANPAARRLLVPGGLYRQAPFMLAGVPAWEALVKTVERAFGDGVWPEAGRDVMLSFDPRQTRTLRVRVRFTRRREAPASEEFCVLLMEDIRNMHARVRQEKLAAMGRVSAAIAHEIRNPLAAISQANALMSEDATTPSQRQLTRMVADNVERLKRIVDDVMQAAPGEPGEAVPIDVVAEVGAGSSDWARAAGVSLGVQSPLRVELPTGSLGVLFDKEHLRRVLINLLDNAYRHSSRQPGSVHLRLQVHSDTHIELSVASDGVPIPADIERHLFEPFFSTRSRGTGLGLYICRELCERYGASIDYRLRPAGEPNRNEFHVSMRRQTRADAADLLKFAG